MFVIVLYSIFWYFWCYLFLICFSLFMIMLLYSGDGSHHSNGDDRTPTAMARAVTVHCDTNKVMYFAWVQHVLELKQFIIFQKPLHLKSNCCLLLMLSLMLFLISLYLTPIPPPSSSQSKMIISAIYLYNIYMYIYRYH